jgi:hypothetical protein
MYSSEEGSHDGGSGSRGVFLSGLFQGATAKSSFLEPYKAEKKITSTVSGLVVFASGTLFVPPLLPAAVALQACPYASFWIRQNYSQ